MFLQAQTPDRHPDVFDIVFSHHAFVFEGYNSDLAWIDQEQHVKDAFKFYFNKLMVEPLDTEILLCGLIHARPEERHYPK